MRLKRYVSVIGHSSDDVELRYGIWNPVSWSLSDAERSGKLFSFLTSLDGSRKPAEIGRELGLSRSQVEAILDQLISLGVLEDASATAVDAYIDRIIPTLRPMTTAPKLPSEVVIIGPEHLASVAHKLLAESIGQQNVMSLSHLDDSIRALSENSSEWLSDSLSFTTRLERFQNWRGKFIMVLGDAPDLPLLQKINRVSLALQINWMQATLDGPFLFVGPITKPNQSSCYECFETRISMNMRDLVSYQRYKSALVQGKTKLAAFEAEPALRQLLCSHACLEAINFFLTGRSFTVGKVFSIYFPTMEITYNEVLRLPLCPACAPVPFRDEQELYFDVRALLGKEKRDEGSS